MSVFQSLFQFRQSLHGQILSLLMKEDARHLNHMYSIASFEISLAPNFITWHAVIYHYHITFISTFNNIILYNI